MYILICMFINMYILIVCVLNIYIIDDDNQEEADKDDEDEIGCNENITADCMGDSTTNQDNSKKVNILICIMYLLFSTDYENFQVNLKEIVDKIHICSICLGDASDDVNELIDCDECGISVHEGNIFIYFHDLIRKVNNYIICRMLWSARFWKYKFISFIMFYGTVVL